MKIASVRAAPIVAPTALGRSRQQRAEWHDHIDHMNPLGAVTEFEGQANRFAPRWPDVVCVVTTIDGEFGIGMTDVAGPVVPIVNDYLAPMIVGLDARAVEDLWDMMATACAAHIGLSGVAARALSAVDLALWDLRGKVEGQPVRRIINTNSASELACYATGLEVAQLRELGFDAFKLPCPWGPELSRSIRAITDLVGSTRAIVGDDTELMLDGWGVLDRDGAAAVARAVAPFGLRWFEDALHPDDLEGWSDVRNAAPDLPRAAGERWYRIHDFERAAAGELVEVLQPDALWVGGATPTIRIAQLAATHGCELAVHCAANDSYGQHLAFALQPDSRAEMYVESATKDLFSGYRSTPGMSIPRNGIITASDDPGFGLGLTMEDIERLT